MNLELLKGGLSILGIDLESSRLDKIAAYTDAIEKWNPAYGLVGANGDELVIKHILDSLAPLRLIDDCARECLKTRLGPESTTDGISLADLGTGAGLPGIPLAIAREEYSVSLIDRMTRRINFLRTMKAQLPLPNAEVIEDQVERTHGCYDLITFRAFKPFERKLFRRVFALCSRDGFVIAYKGRRDRVEAELPEIEGLYSEIAIHRVQVPYLDEERCVAILRPLVKS